MRNEIKIKGNLNDHYEALKGIKLKKTYSDRNINSIYFDTDNFDFFEDGEEGVTPRIKIRYRWYNDSEIFGGYIEIKKKFTFYSTKERIKKNNFSYESLHKNVNNLFEKKLIPTLLVSYKRRYYEDSNNNRYTLDNAISYYSLDRYFKTKNSKKVFYSILEIKKTLYWEQKNRKYYIDQS